MCLLHLCCHCRVPSVRALLYCLCDTLYVTTAIGFPCNASHQHSHPAARGRTNIPQPTALWLKEKTVLEQPSVTLTNKMLIVVEGLQSGKPFHRVWTSSPELNDMAGSDLIVPSVSVRRCWLRATHSHYSSHSHGSSGFVSDLV